MSDIDTPTPDLLVPAAPLSPVPAPITSITVDPAAREVAVQAAIDQTKAEAAVAALDAASQPEDAPPVPEPSHGVPSPVAPAPAVDLEPEESVEEAPLEQCGEEEPEMAPRPLDYDRFVALEAKVLELSEHVEELVSHLAQSFGGEYAAKKSRMGV